MTDCNVEKIIILANEFDASSYCKVLNDSILYLLQVCPDIWKPVCSSEEITYGNICKLKKVNIRSPHVSIVFSQLSQLK